MEKSKISLAYSKKRDENKKLQNEEVDLTQLDSKATTGAVGDRHRLDR